MKIILIKPFITSKERYGTNIGGIGGHQAPLGLCYLASYLEEKGVNVSLIDAEAENLNEREVAKRVAGFSPDAVGITSTTVAFHRAISLASYIKIHNPILPIIIGGPHVTANPIETLSLKCFDYGVLYEGEITIYELLKSLINEEAVKDVTGIVYKKGDGVTINAPTPYIKNLDSLPFPARHLLPGLNRYTPPLGSYAKTPVVNMITSRGCPYKCIFCDRNVFGNITRYHSPEYVISEIEYAVRTYGAKEIHFVDDTFAVDEGRVRRIIDLMGKRNIRIKWSCMTRADNLTRNLARDMRSAGCWLIGIGIESGNQQILDFIKKNVDLEQIRNAAKWCDDAGIIVKGFFMMGHPLDTSDTIDETISFAKELPLTDIVATFATPIPGSEFYSMAPRYGTLNLEDWSNFSYWKPVFEPAGLNGDTLYKKRKKFYRKFYLRPAALSRQIRKLSKVSHPIGYAAQAARLMVRSII